MTSHAISTVKERFFGQPKNDKEAVGAGNKCTASQSAELFVFSLVVLYIVQIDFFISYCERVVT